MSHGDVNYASLDIRRLVLHFPLFLEIVTIFKGHMNQAQFGNKYLNTEVKGDNLILTQKTTYTWFFITYVS